VLPSAGAAVCGEAPRPRFRVQGPALLKEPSAARNDTAALCHSARISLD
jgi:hypothetical protein